MSDGIFDSPRLDLSEVIGSLLDKGVALRGDAIISVADVDLVNLDLGILLVAMETLARRSGQRSLLATALGTRDFAGVHESEGRRLNAGTGGRSAAATAEVSPVSRSEYAQAPLREVAPALPERINVDPEGVENGLARLVLTLIEVLRKVLEHQAIRRMDGGTLSAQEVERLGLALLKLHDRMQELKAVFGLTDEDLQIDLGPLGRVR